MFQNAMAIFAGHILSAGKWPYFNFATHASSVLLIATVIERLDDGFF
jgi:hypothetical protein